MSDTIRTRLEQAGLRATRQRCGLAALLFDGRDRHVSADELHREAAAAGLSVSLATIYNTLAQFSDAGLLRELIVGQGVTFYDTNTSAHHHMLDECTGQLADLPADAVKIAALPELPEGAELTGVDVILRYRSKCRR